MKTNALNTIKKYAMLADGDNVAVGVSGGADSIALLYFLRFDCGIELNLIACHINHMLRGADADSDQSYVESVCREWGIPCEVLKKDVNAYRRETGGSFEDAARRVRYAFFDEVSKKYGGCKIATAHTLSDRAETLLLNITRGSAVSGLCSIPPVRENIIRPLISCTREQIETYCEQNGLKFVTDRTNLSDEYARNRIRLNVIPELLKINPGFYSACSRLIASAEADSEYLERLSADALGSARKGDGYEAEKILPLPAALRTRAAAHILRENYLEVSADRIAQIENTLATGQQANVSKNKFACLRKGVLYIQSADACPPFCIPITAPCTAVLPGGKSFKAGILNADEYNSFKKVNKNFFYLTIDCDKIIGKLVLRQRQNGDRVRLSGRRVTKTLKKLFNEAGLSALQKSETPVIADNSGIAAVFGFGVSEQHAPDNNTRRFLVITKGV